MKILQLALKGEYFDAIKSGEKLEEFRLITPYWTKRLKNADGTPVQFDQVILTKGYPKAGDPERTICVPYVGLREVTLTHRHFGDQPVHVFAINVSGEPILPHRWTAEYS